MRTKITRNQFDLEYFFELSADLICISGYDGYFKKINPAVSKIMGYSEAELLASPINSFIHSSDRELSSKKLVALRNGDPVFQFENRYVTKDGSIIWLFWTAVPIERDQLIFAIAKDITAKKNAEGGQRVSRILSQLNTEQMKKFSQDIDIIKPVLEPDGSNLKWLGGGSSIDYRDQLWLNKFEALVRSYAGSQKISLKVLSKEMANSERQLFRQVGRIMGTTPNKLVRTIRLHLAWEAIASRKYQTLSEVAAIAGYASRTHFKRLFQDVYGIDVNELL